MTAAPERVITGLRVWAAGMLPTEAGVHVLITACHGRLLDGPWVRVDGDHVWFDTSAVDHPIGLSGGERRLLRIAASLADPACPVSLADVLVGLDAQHLRLVIAAVAHAAGWDEVVTS